jgi:hypothetical protein
MRQHLKRWAVIGTGCITLAVGVPAIALSMRMASTSPDSDPFQGIGAVTQAPTGESVLDAKTANTLHALNGQGFGKAVLGSQLVAEARELPTTIIGKRLYLIPTETGKLCAFLEGGTEACTEPLSEARPAAVVAMDDDGPGGVGALVFGVAIDGVRTISFTAAGKRHVVLVRGNVFAFQGSPMMTAECLSEQTATFDDGTTVRLP